MMAGVWPSLTASSPTQRVPAVVESREFSCVTLDRERFILPAAICTHPPLANDIQYTLPQPGSGTRRVMPCPLVSVDAQCVDDVREERPPTYS